MYLLYYFASIALCRVNLDLRKNFGTHWIALALYHNDIYVCDSLGTFFPNQRLPIELINFLHVVSFNKRIHITYQLQSLLSSTCGKYSSFFILKMSSSNNYDSFLSNFSTNLGINDCIIDLLFESCFNKHLKKYLYCFTCRMHHKLIILSKENK